MRNLVLVGASLFLLGGCGDFPLLPTADDAPTPEAGGGIGGTGGQAAVAGIGKGSITGFGSVIVNDTRTFATDENTQFLMDEGEVTESELRAEGTGLVVRIELGEDVNAEVTSGTAVRVLAENLLKGPVTSLQPLRVLGQTVVATGDTVVGTGDTVVPAPTVLADLALGNIVEVSGYANPDNVIQATRIVLEADGSSNWKLTGKVTAVGTATITIGTQAVDTGGLAGTGCDTGPVVGGRVKVRAHADAGFAPGDVLAGVTDLRCLSPGLELPENLAGATLRANAEGLVTTVALPELTVDGQGVLTTASTTYQGGGTVDIVIGAKLEVQGVLDTTTNVLTAERIRFRESRVRLEAPLAAASIVVGVSAVVLGVTMHATPLTEDEDTTLTAGNGDVQIEMRGFVDSTGKVFASRIRERGAPDPSDVRVRGPISALPGPPLVSVLGIKVNTTGMTFQNSDGTSLTQTDFFALLSIGTEIDVKGAFDGVDTITVASTRGEIAIEN